MVTVNLGQALKQKVIKLNTKAEKGLYYERGLMMQSQVLREINSTTIKYKFTFEILSLHWNYQKFLRKIFWTEIYFYFVLFVEDTACLIRNFCETKCKYGTGNPFKHFIRNKK